VLSHYVCLLVTLLAAGAALAVPAAGTAARRATPDITAKPDSVMVNGTTNLTALAFADTAR